MRSVNAIHHGGSDDDASSAEQLAGDAVSVTRVIYGDTIEVSTGEKVRLIGIDTPVI